MSAEEWAGSESGSHDLTLQDGVPTKADDMRGWGCYCTPCPRYALAYTRARLREAIRCDGMDAEGIDAGDNGHLVNRTSTPANRLLIRTVCPAGLYFFGEKRRLIDASWESDKDSASWIIETNDFD